MVSRSTLFTYFLGLVISVSINLRAENPAAQARIQVQSVAPYIFPVPSGYTGYVVSGFVRSSENLDGAGGVQNVCVLVSADHSAPIQGSELPVNLFVPGMAELERLRAEYDQYSKKLIAVYMQMPEFSFFRLLDELSIEEQARIFAMMKAEDLAKYLSILEPQKAHTITALLSKQRQMSAVYESAKTKGLVVFTQ